LIFFIYFGPTHVKNGCVPRSSGIRLSGWGKQRNQSVGRFECARLTDATRDFDQIYGRRETTKRTHGGDFSAPAAGHPTTTPFGAFCFVFGACA
jgi:hypothetical protein